MLVIGFAAWTVLYSTIRHRSLSRCSSCRPRCPNRHQIEIAGEEGRLFVAITVLVLLLVEKLL